MTPIADGTYTISNVQFPGSYINLSRGLPHAAINAWTSKNSTNQQWIVKNVGDNQITLENVTAPGYYASSYFYARAASIYGSENPTYWTVVEVSEGIYNLEAQGFQLALTQEGKLATIFLGPLYDTSAAEEQQWKFKAV